MPLNFQLEILGLNSLMVNKYNKKILKKKKGTFLNIQGQRSIYVTLKVKNF